MGCNCGGSTARTKNEPRRFTPTVQERPTNSVFRERRKGGPGEPGYYFNGPRKPAAS